MVFIGALSLLVHLLQVVATLTADIVAGMPIDGPVASNILVCDVGHLLRAHLNPALQQTLNVTRVGQGATDHQRIQRGGAARAV